MNLSHIDDNILLEDIKKLVNSELPWEKFKNQTLFITGATGMIGSQIVKALLYCNEMKQTDIKVMALIRDYSKAEKVFGALVKASGLKLICEDINNKLQVADRIDYIIHGASITGSKDFIETPVDTIKTAVNGSMNLLEFAREKKVKGVVYLSSFEVYGVTDVHKESITEEDYGYLDPLNVRSSYSESKRLAECICVAYSKQYGVPVKIARLSQTFGAGVEFNDNRVFAQFAKCVIEKKDITLHTHGETVRNYCYTRDAIKAIFYILLWGESGAAYNVANESTTISIKDMAQLLINQYPEAKINIVYELSDQQSRGYNPIIKIKLSTVKLEALGWKAEVELDEMFDRMIHSMIYRNKKALF